MEERGRDTFAPCGKQGRVDGASNYQRRRRRRRGPAAEGCSGKLREASGREPPSRAPGRRRGRGRGGEGEGIQKRGLPLGLGIEGAADEEIIVREKKENRCAKRPTHTSRRLRSPPLTGGPGNRMGLPVCGVSWWGGGLRGVVGEAAWPTAGSDEMCRARVGFCTRVRSG